MEASNGTIAFGKGISLFSAAVILWAVMTCFHLEEKLAGHEAIIMDAEISKTVSSESLRAVNSLESEISILTVISATAVGFSVVGIGMLVYAGKQRSTQRSQKHSSDGTVNVVTLGQLLLVVGMGGVLWSSTKFFHVDDKLAEKDVALYAADTSTMTDIGGKASEVRREGILRDRDDLKEELKMLRLFGIAGGVAAIFGLGLLISIRDRG